MMSCFLSGKISKRQWLLYFILPFSFPPLSCQQRSIAWDSVTSDGKITDCNTYRLTLLQA